MSPDIGIFVIVTVVCIAVGSMILQALERDLQRKIKEKKDRDARLRDELKNIGVKEIRDKLPIDPNDLENRQPRER